MVPNTKYQISVVWSSHKWTETGSGTSVIWTGSNQTDSGTRHMPALDCYLLTLFTLKMLHTCTYRSTMQDIYPR